jgi:excisionase family DNA binding protein
MDTISPNVTGKKIEAEWVSIRDACIMLSVSRPTIYKFIAEGRLEAKKLGLSKSIVSVASIRALPDTLPDVKASLPKPRRQKPDVPPLRRGPPHANYRKPLEAAE